MRSTGSISECRMRERCELSATSRHTKQLTRGERNDTDAYTPCDDPIPSIMHTLRYDVSLTHASSQEMGSAHQALW